MIEYEVILEVKNHKNKRYKKGTFEVPVGIPLYWKWCYAIGRAISKLEDDERIVSISVKGD